MPSRLSSTNREISIPDRADQTSQSVVAWRRTASQQVQADMPHRRPTTNSTGSARRWQRAPRIFGPRDGEGRQPGTQCEQRRPQRCRRPGDDAARLKAHALAGRQVARELQVNPGVVERQARFADDVDLGDEKRGDDHGRCRHTGRQRTARKVVVRARHGDHLRTQAESAPRYRLAALFTPLSLAPR